MFTKHVHAPFKSPQSPLRRLPVEMLAKHPPDPLSLTGPKSGQGFSADIQPSKNTHALGTEVAGAPFFVVADTYAHKDHPSHICRHERFNDCRNGLLWGRSKQRTKRDFKQSLKKRFTILSGATAGCPIAFRSGLSFLRVIQDPYGVDRAKNP